MEEKKSTKVGLLTFLLIIAIIIIGIIGYLAYKFYNENMRLKFQVGESNIKISLLEKDLANNLKEEKKEDEEQNTKIEDTNDKEEPNAKIEDTSYLTNLGKSVSEQLGEHNNIYLDISNYDDNKGYGYVEINNKHEAYIYLSSIEGYSSASNLKKIASNVVNAWYCEEGQSSGNNYIVFSKLDGTVTYVRFKTDFSNGSKTVFESDEKTLPGITDISDIVPIAGNDANGIGGMGVLFIKKDGTCLPYSTLNNLTKVK